MAVHKPMMWRLFMLEALSLVDSNVSGCSKANHWLSLQQRQVDKQNY